MSDKTNPSELYDEEFLKKKEEFYSKMEDISTANAEIQEDDGSFEELIDDFADSDLMSRLGSKKEKKSKKNKKEKKKKKQAVVDTPEPEYDIFNLGDDFPSMGEKKKEKKNKEKKEKKAPAAEKKAPPKPKEPLKPV